MNYLRMNTPLNGCFSNATMVLFIFAISSYCYWICFTFAWDCKQKHLLTKDGYFLLVLNSFMEAGKIHWKCIENHPDFHKPEHTQVLNWNLIEFFLRTRKKFLNVSDSRKKLHYKSFKWNREREKKVMLIQGLSFFTHHKTGRKITKQ